MRGQHLNSLEQLIPNYSHWNDSQTCVIRVPKKLKHKVLDYAHGIDKNQILNRDCSTVTQELLDISKKIEMKEKGYKSNSAGQLIKDIKNIVKNG